jgi:hypothetical protein
MEKLQIDFEIEVDDEVAEKYQQASEDIKNQLKQSLTFWLEKHLQMLKDQPKANDPWLEFLDNIDDYAVDTGIEDFSVNHEYYLYGGPKRQPSAISFQLGLKLEADN